MTGLKRSTRVISTLVLTWALLNPTGRAQGLLDLDQSSFVDSTDLFLFSIQWQEAADTGQLLTFINSWHTVTSTPPLENESDPGKFRNVAPGWVPLGETYVYAPLLSTEITATGFSLEAAPTGMTISNTSGLIEWTPSVSQVGSHQVILAVSAGSETFRQSFMILVSDESMTSSTTTGAGGGEWFRMVRLPLSFPLMPSANR